LRNGRLQQLTIDHSVVAELIASGHLTESEAETDPRRSMITRALGIEADVEVDVVPLPLQAGDRLLFCSDGLTTMIGDDAIASVLRDESDRDRAATALVAAANDAGGVDNITVLVIDAVDDGMNTAAEGSASAAVGERANTLPTAPAPAAPPDPPDDTDELAVTDPAGALAAAIDETELEAAPKRRRWRRRKT
jgi:serine/threonine protein phosphatase PrpC